MSRAWSRITESPQSVTAIPPRRAALLPLTCLGRSPSICCRRSGLLRSRHVKSEVRSRDVRPACRRQGSDRNPAFLRLNPEEKSLELSRSLVNIVQHGESVEPPLVNRKKTFGTPNGNFRTRRRTNDSGTARAQGRQHHHDLHARPEQWGARGEESDGWFVGRLIQTA